MRRYQRQNEGSGLARGSTSHRSTRRPRGYARDGDDGIEHAKQYAARYGAVGALGALAIQLRPDAVERYSGAPTRWLRHLVLGDGRGRLVAQGTGQRLLRDLFGLVPRRAVSPARLATRRRRARRPRQSRLRCPSSRGARAPRRWRRWSPGGEQGARQRRHVARRRAASAIDPHARHDVRSGGARLRQLSPSAAGNGSSTLARKRASGRVDLLRVPARRACDRVLQHRKDNRPDACFRPAATPSNHALGAGMPRRRW